MAIIAKQNRISDPNLNGVHVDEIFSGMILHDRFKMEDGLSFDEIVDEAVKKGVIHKSLSGVYLFFGS